MKKSFFVSFEGGDGSGKTTQIGHLQEYLINKGIDAVILREPGGVKISEKIREIVLDKQNSEMDMVTEMLLYAAARAQLVSEVIRPCLERGTSIICDRFVDSSYIYQGYARGLGIDVVKTVNDIATGGIMPDLTFFMDIDPEVALRRRLNAGQPDRLEMENISFHRRVYEGYVHLSSLFPERVKRISGENGIEESFLQIKGYVDGLLCRYN